MADPRFCPLYCEDANRDRIPMERDARHGDYACSACGLAGPAEALDRVIPNGRRFTKQELAELASEPRPDADKLAEDAMRAWEEANAEKTLIDAEQLLRAAGVFMGEEGGVSLRHCMRGERVAARTLFEAYEACRKIQEAGRG